MQELRELLGEELKDVYDAEKQLVSALPKMANAAEDEELRQAFAQHLEETKKHVKRLEQVFEELDLPKRGRKCAGMQGLIEEGKERIKEEAGDPALISAAQRVEHYEIAAYGTITAWAEALGETRVVDLMHQTLEEESAANEKLTSIATEVNARAMEDEEEEKAA